MRVFWKRRWRKSQCLETENETTRMGIKGRRERVGDLSRKVGVAWTVQCGDTRTGLSLQGTGNPRGPG